MTVSYVCVGGKGRQAQIASIAHGASGTEHRGLTACMGRYLQTLGDLKAEIGCNKSATGGQIGEWRFHLLDCV